MPISLSANVFHHLDSKWHNETCVRRRIWTVYCDCRQAGFFKQKHSHKRCFPPVHRGVWHRWARSVFIETHRNEHACRWPRLTAAFLPSHSFHTPLWLNVLLMVAPVGGLQMHVNHNSSDRSTGERFGRTSHRFTPGCTLLGHDTLSSL